LKSEERHDNDDDDDDEDAEDEDDEAFVQRELYSLPETDDEDEDSEDDDNDAKFEDFFGSSKRMKVHKPKSSTAARGHDGDEDDDGEEEEGSDDDEEEGSDEEEGEGSDDDDDEEEGSGDETPGAETSYSRKQRQLREQISLLEETAVGAKSWEVAGEVKSSQRPENSLLGIPVDVER
jgi:U3 small nucleolar ribonucleoprotein component